MGDTLMDKQIRDIAKIIGDDYCEIFNDGQGQDCGLDCTMCRARRLYDANYRKIPENAVVLTREEYERLKSIEKLLDDGYFSSDIYYVKRNTRKETAEKFAKMADKRIAQRQGERDGYEAFTIDDKARYDGDIISLALYEICKEITEGKA